MTFVLCFNAGLVKKLIWFYILLCFTFYYVLLLI